MASVIRLLDSSGVKVIDCVSGEYEDSFTLESFEDMIDAHVEAGMKADGKPKSFIIARVQTWDHNQPDREFYSYYCAHQLNKVIIKVQKYMDKKLIHRLHVLNPLTNSDIIGNIQYFKVDPRSKHNLTEDKSEKVAGQVPDTTERTKSEIENDGTDTSKFEQPVSSPSSPMTTLERSKKPKLTIETKKPNLLKGKGGLRDVVPATPTVKEIESGVKATWTLSGPAAVEVEDDEDDKRDEQVEDKTKKDAVTHSTVSSKPPRSPWVGSFLSPSRTKTKKAGTPSSATASTSAQKSPKSPSVYSPTKPMSVADGRKSTIQSPTQARIPIPAGTLTQYAQPKTKDEIKASAPPTAKGRRRTLSYLNSVAQLGPSTTVDQWIGIVEAEKEIYRKIESTTTSPLGKSPTKKSPTRATPTTAKLDNVQEDEETTGAADDARNSETHSILPEAGEIYDEIHHIDSPQLPSPPRGELSTPHVSRDAPEIPPKDTTTTTAESEAPANGTSSVPQADAPTGEKKEVGSTLSNGPTAELHANPMGGNTDLLNAIGSNGETIKTSWDAVLFATDVDFLESAAIRTIFRKNALSIEESKLFELPPVTSDPDNPPEESSEETPSGDANQEADEGSICCF